MLGQGGEEDGKEEDEEEEKDGGKTIQREELHDWEYEGFTECSESCGGGKLFTDLYQSKQ